MCEIPRKFDIDSLYICPPYLYTVTTLPWEIQKKVIFQHYYSYRLQIITVSQKKQSATVVLQLICLLTVVYCFLISAILWSVFLSLFSVILKPPMPNHNWLFSESSTFGGMQHYLQSDVKVLHFTR